jgi:adenine/guanine phosphoribosyltransferase-like PRPP-binding protein
MTNKIVASRGNPKSWFTVFTNLGPAEVGVMQFPDLSFSFYCDLLPLVGKDMNKGLKRHEFRQSCINTVTVTMLTTIPEAIIGLYQLYSCLGAQKNGENIDLRGFDLDLIVQTAPDQRADKATVPGEGCPAWTSGMLIGQIGFDRITVYDVHSEMFLKALRINSQLPVTHVKPIECYEMAFAENWDKPNSTLVPAKPLDFVVAVDAGAEHRVTQFAEHYNTGIIRCEKKRDEMGKITGHQILSGAGPNLDQAKDSTFWVIDDLCDGGATFLSVASILRESYKFKNLNLYVTHGLFSKGKDELLKVYDNVFALFDYSN